MASCHPRAPASGAADAGSQCGQGRRVSRAVLTPAKCSVRQASGCVSSSLCGGIVGGYTFHLEILQASHFR